MIFYFKIHKLYSALHFLRQRGTRPSSLHALRHCWRSSAHILPHGSPNISGFTSIFTNLPLQVNVLPSPILPDHVPSGQHAQPSRQIKSWSSGNGEQHFAEERTWHNCCFVSLLKGLVFGFYVTSVHKAH